MTRPGTRDNSLSVKLRHAWHRSLAWLLVQCEWIALGRGYVTLPEVKRDADEYRATYTHERHGITVKRNKAHRTVTVTGEWRKHRDDYVKTGSLASFRHMVESVTVTMVRSDPNDTPTAVK